MSDLSFNSYIYLAKTYWYFSYVGIGGNAENVKPKLELEAKEYVLIASVTKFLTGCYCLR